MTSQTTVNLFPEARKRKLSPQAQTQPAQARTGTSKYFTPLEIQAQIATPATKMEIDEDDWPPSQDEEMSVDVDVDVDELKDDDNPDTQEVSSRATSGKRQMKLDFSNGMLTTKKALINPIRRGDPRRVTLKDIAAETLLLLPGLLATRPDVGRDSYLCQGETIDQKYKPRNPPVTVRVRNMDTIDAALSLQTGRPHTYRGRPVAILNMANAYTPGGGWKHGAMAQEEALCYRSSLYLTLKRRYYPIPEDAVIYSPTVMIIRENMQNGNDLLDFRSPRRLDVISVISCAAVCLPSLTTGANGLPTYAIKSERRLMREKMRVILRTAIRNKHRSIILGALGCGAFGNPNLDVVKMWKQVLQEPDFQGGWWEDVVFAVMGTGKPGDNFRVFFDELDGLILN